MTARRLPLPALLALPPVALAAYTASEATSHGPVEGFEALTAGILVICVGAAALLIPPVYAISGAIVLSLFQNHWDALGVSFNVDRYATLLVLASALAREWRRRGGRLETRPIDWLLAVTMIYAVTSAWVVAELTTVEGRIELVDRFGVMPFLLFFVAPFVFRTEADRKVLLAALVGIGAYLSVTAVLETVGADALIVPGYIADESQGIHQDRARGPFLDAGANGVALYMCAVAATIAFVKWRDPRWRAFALVVAGACMLGVLLTLTRAVWLGALVATPLALLAARPTRRFLFPAILAGVAVVLLAFAAIPGLQERASKRRGDKQPVWDRQNSNAAAIRMIEERPVFGFGWNRFKAEGAAYYRQSPDYPLGDPGNLHNVYLAYAVHLGLAGFFLWAAAMAAVMGGAIFRRGPPELFAWKIGLLAILVCVLIEWATAPNRYVLPLLLLWLWAGVAWGERRSEGVDVDDPGAPRELKHA